MRTLKAGWGLKTFSIDGLSGVSRQYFGFDTYCQLMPAFVTLIQGFAYGDLVFTKE